MDSSIPHLIAPASPPILPKKIKNISFPILAFYIICIIFFLNKAIKTLKRGSVLTSVPIQHNEEAPQVMPRSTARLRFYVTCVHVVLSLWINGFMSALLGIALSRSDFTEKFLPGYDEGVAGKENSNAICNFVDSSVLLLSTIYDVAIIVGIFLYAMLSQRLSLRWMVLVTPTALWIGVLTSYLAGKLSTLVVGRFFMGLAPGFVVQINNRLIREFAPQPARGGLLWCCDKLTYLGSMAAYGIAFYVSDHTRPWMLTFYFLVISLIIFTIFCSIITACYTGNMAPITFRQLHQARALIPLRIKYQIFTAVLGLDVLIQYIPEYCDFLDLKRDTDYLISLGVSLITMLTIIFASLFKLERFGRWLLFALVLIVSLAVSIIHVLLARGPTPTSAPHWPGLLLSVTIIYCIVIGLSKIDPKTLESPDDVRPAISALNRAVESTINIIIVLFVSYLGCILQLYVLFFFVGFIVFAYEVISDDF